MENEGGNPLVSPVNKEIREAQKKVLIYQLIQKATLNPVLDFIILNVICQFNQHSFIVLKMLHNCKI